MNKIIINAVNIHNGGGEILLNQLISSLPDRNVIIFCSKKLKLINNNKQDIKFIKIKSNFFSRLLSELSIYKKSKQNDKVLYFGNLPPILKMRAYVYLYIHIGIYIYTDRCIDKCIDFCDIYIYMYICI